MFALVAVVLPNVWLTWDLPNPQVWTAAFLVLLLLHAERSEMPRGAWFELWLAATVLTVMQLALLARSRLDPVIHLGPNPPGTIPWYVMWGCVMALAGLLVLAAHRYRTPIRLAAAVLGVLGVLGILLVLVLSDVIRLQDLEAVLGAVLCLHTALLAVRHRRGRGVGTAILVCLWLTAVLLAVFLVLNHPVAFRAYGVEAVLATTLISWACLGLLTAAVLDRARRVTPDSPAPPLHP